MIRRTVRHKRMLSTLSITGVEIVGMPEKP